MRILNRVVLPSEVRAFFRLGFSGWIGRPRPVDSGSRTDPPGSSARGKRQVKAIPLPKLQRRPAGRIELDGGCRASYIPLVLQSGRSLKRISPRARAAAIGTRMERAATAWKHTHDLPLLLHC